MKKVYSFLMLMLAFCGIGTAQAGVVVNSIGEPITDISAIAEGDYLAFQETESDKYLFNNKYNNTPTTYSWRLMFERGDFPAAIGQASSEQYVWKVVGLTNNGNTISCQLQDHVGSYIPVLDNAGLAGFNFASQEAETFTFTKGSNDDTWILSGASGPKFTAGQTTSRWFALIGTTEGSEFKIYKPTVEEGAATVKVRFECYDEEGTEITQYTKSEDVIVGESITIPRMTWGFSFVSCVDDLDNAYAEGQQVTINEPTTFTLTVAPWPYITFAYFDEAGAPIYEEGSTEPAQSTTQWQPGRTFTSVGGVYGYYVPQDVLAQYTSMIITNDMDGMVFNITCKKAPFVTVRYVNEKDEDIATPYENYTTPGESIPVAEVSWYTLNAADSIYVYNYETMPGYTVGTEDTTIVLHYTTDEMPFEATTAVDGVLADNTKWYTIAFHGNKYMNSELKLVNIDTPEEITNDVQWAFVGSLEDGYLIYNKATGSKTLGVEKVEEGAAPSMIEAGSTFLLKKNNGGKLTLSLITLNQYWMSIDACLNDYDGKDEVKLYIGEWGGTGSEGSHITFTEAGELGTGVEEIAPATQKADHAIYDIQGRKVTNPQRGLYIIGGKLMFVK